MLSTQIFLPLDVPPPSVLYSSPKNVTVLRGTTLLHLLSLSTCIRSNLDVV